MGNCKIKVRVETNVTDIGDCLKTALAALLKNELMIDTAAKEKKPAGRPDVIVFYPAHGDRLHEWLWMNLKKRASAAVLILGHAAENAFYQEHPVFDGHYGAKDSYKYMSIPFRLEDLKAKLLELRPLTKNEFEALARNYAMAKPFIVGVVLHKLKDPENRDREDILRRLSVAEQYFSRENKTKEVEAISKAITRVKSLPPGSPCGKDISKLAMDLVDAA